MPIPMSRSVCFNPLADPALVNSRLHFGFLGRVNRRMHNKLMVVDNAAAIVGGRNIGDIYYGVNTIANYRDLDVLAVGPVIGASVGGRMIACSRMTNACTRATASTICR